MRVKVDYKGINARLLINTFDLKANLAVAAIGRSTAKYAKEQIIAAQNTQTSLTRRRRDGNGTIVGSTPNEWPNIETGGLVNSIKSKMSNTVPLRAEITASAINPKNGADYAGVINHRNKYLPRAFMDNKAKYQVFFQQALKINTK